MSVTQQLVALALQNSPKVAEATRAKILAVAEELGYDANANRSDFRDWKWAAPLCECRSTNSFMGDMANFLSSYAFIR